MGKIAEVTVPAGGQATIDFSAIPQTYEHLLVVFAVRSDAAGQAANQTVLHVQINGDTGANYECVVDYNNTLERYQNQTSFYGAYVSAGGTPAGRPSAGLLELPHYLNTTWHKALLMRVAFSQGADSSTQMVEDARGYWASTAAITELTLSLRDGNFVAGSVATLYGVA